MPAREPPPARHGHRTACFRRDHPTTNKENPMSKGMDAKKNEKKKPAKTLKEKRAAKQEKKKSQ